jgi:hypothetical protein
VLLQAYLSAQTGCFSGAANMMLLNELLLLLLLLVVVVVWQLL